MWKAAIDTIATTIPDMLLGFPDESGSDDDGDDDGGGVDVGGADTEETKDEWKSEAEAEEEGRTWRARTRTSRVMMHVPDHWARAPPARLTSASGGR